MNKIIFLIKEQWNSYPKTLKVFLLKILFITIIWKLSYQLLLKPSRLIDIPLTNITTKTTISFLQPFYGNIITYNINNIIRKNEYYTAYILQDGKKIIGIADPCNGLELFMLYALFLLCMPIYKIRRLLVFLVFGIFVIFILNVLRCCAMFWLSASHNSLFDFAHHYLFKIIVYLVIFFGWVVYARKTEYE